MVERLLILAPAATTDDAQARLQAVGGRLLARYGDRVWVAELPPEAAADRPRRRRLPGRVRWAGARSPKRSRTRRVALGSPRGTSGNPRRSGPRAGRVRAKAGRGTTRVSNPRADGPTPRARRSTASAANDPATTV